MEIVCYNKYSDLDAIEDAWTQLGERSLYPIPSFVELRHHLKDSGAQFRLLVATENSQIKAIACFTYRKATRYYGIASWKLFDLPMQMVTLFGSCVIGEPSESLVRRFFHHAIEGSNFDLINVGEIFIDSPLYKAVTSLSGLVVAWRRSRKTRLWWLIRMPSSFDEYIASLRKTARAHIVKDCHKFEREDPDFRVMQRPEEVEFFLRDAEKISQLTYQWQFGQCVRNDNNTRQQLMRLAENGMLRCYIVYLRGNPCAFGWGKLSYGKFSFQQTGYDPQYRKLSPGTGLIIRMIRDLIENTNCKVFDFSWGSEDGYKSRFGNVSVSCASVQVAKIYRPYSLLIILLDQTLKLATNLVGLIIECGPLRKQLRSARRRHGIETF
jgi:hypothetical protein